MDKVFGLLGLAQRAGRVVSGEQGVETAIRRRKVITLILAVDSSENTRDKFQSLAKRYKIPVFFFGDKAELGYCLGKSARAVIGITDLNFARAIQQKLDGGCNGGE